jgi:hypothetical protein
MGEKGKPFRTTLKGKYDITRFKSRYKYNIKVDVREIRREAASCIHESKTISCEYGH